MFWRCCVRTGVVDVEDSEGVVEGGIGAERGGEERESEEEAHGWEGRGMGGRVEGNFGGWEGEESTFPLSFRWPPREMEGA